MMDELDLERGDAERAERIAALQEEGKTTRRIRRPSKPAAAKPTAASKARATTAQRIEDELLSRLDRTFDRIAEWRLSRGDEELATVISEDKGQMSHGLVSLTRLAPVVRTPLLMILNLLEPALAFGRVGRILAGRWVMRREQIAAERLAAQQGTQYEQQPYPVG